MIDVQLLSPGLVRGFSAQLYRLDTLEAEALRRAAWGDRRHSHFKRALAKLLVIAGKWQAEPVLFRPPHERAMWAQGWRWTGPDGVQIVEGLHSEPPALPPMLELQLVTAEAA